MPPGHAAKTSTPGWNRRRIDFFISWRPDKSGNVTITFSREDPRDGTYWMPVTHDCHFISRYCGPNPKMNGNTVHDILFKGTRSNRSSGQPGIKVDEIGNVSSRPN